MDRAAGVGSGVASDRGRLWAAAASGDGAGTAVGGAGAATVGILSGAGVAGVDGDAVPLRGGGHAAPGGRCGRCGGCGARAGVSGELVGDAAGQATARSAGYSAQRYDQVERHRGDGVGHVATGAEERARGATCSRGRGRGSGR
eukprot:ctg_1623.g512